MRPLIALLVSLSASGASALEIDTGGRFNGAPITTGAIMRAAKVSAFIEQTEFSFANAKLLSDAQIAEMFLPNARPVTRTDAPAIMGGAKEMTP